MVQNHFKVLLLCFNLTLALGALPITAYVVICMVLPRQEGVIPTPSIKRHQEQPPYIYEVWRLTRQAILCFGTTCTGTQSKYRWSIVGDIFTQRISFAPCHYKIHALTPCCCAPSAGLSHWPSPHTLLKSTGSTAPRNKLVAVYKHLHFTIGVCVVFIGINIGARLSYVCVDERSSRWSKEVDVAARTGENPYPPAGDLKQGRRF